eukprot:338174-Rhodomonas_salina.1
MGGICSKCGGEKLHVPGTGPMQQDETNLSSSDTTLQRTDLNASVTADVDVASGQCGQNSRAEYPTERPLT